MADEAGGDVGAGVEGEDTQYEDAEEDKEKLAPGLRTSCWLLLQNEQ
jgi:hypothetical protein